MESLKVVSLVPLYFFPSYVNGFTDIKIPLLYCKLISYADDTIIILKGQTCAKALQSVELGMNTKKG